MNDRPTTEQVETLVIGGGQAGLAMGHHLGRRELPYAIVDANDRVGDAWRNRWDSLHLFTPNRLNALPGMAQPGYHWKFPSKDEMADYLEAYAEHFEIPVQTGVRIERLSRQDERFVALAEGRRFTADNVVVAMSSWQQPRVPDFADQLDDRIVQLTAADYRNPGQLKDGDVLVVGVGNSGAEIALELARTHDVSLAGSDNGVLPFRPESVAARVLMPLVGRVVFHRVLTTGTPVGRRARPTMQATGEPLIRTKPKDLDAAGVHRVPRVTEVRDGLPRLEDGTQLDVANVVWCTGFQPEFSWIDLDVLESATSEPEHRRGVVEDLPGLYFLGLKFLHAVSSEQIHGVGRDAAHIAEVIASRQGSHATDAARGSRAGDGDPGRLQHTG